MPSTPTADLLAGLLTKHRNKDKRNVDDVENVQAATQENVVRSENNKLAGKLDYTRKKLKALEAVVAESYETINTLQASTESLKAEQQRMQATIAGLLEVAMEAKGFLSDTPQIRYSQSLSRLADAIRDYRR